jgi:molybdopterin converting factor small subunit
MKGASITWRCLDHVGERYSHGFHKTNGVVIPSITVRNDVEFQPLRGSAGQVCRVKPECVRVIPNDTLVPHDDRLDDPDTVEIRPVISGG